MSNAMAVQVWSEGNRYGRYEIKKYFHRNFVRGMVASFAIHAVVVSAYYIPQLIGGGEEDIPLVKVRMVKYSELGPPPSISQARGKPTTGGAWRRICFPERVRRPRLPNRPHPARQRLD